jgi:hypothetical protein
MISGRAVPALERLFFSVSRGKSAGQADQHSTLPQPWVHEGHFVIFLTESPTFA